MSADKYELLLNCITTTLHGCVIRDTYVYSKR